MWKRSRRLRQLDGRADSEAELPENWKTRPRRNRCQSRPPVQHGRQRPANRPAAPRAGAVVRQQPHRTALERPLEPLAASMRLISRLTGSFSLAATVLQRIPEGLLEGNRRGCPSILKERFTGRLMGDPDRSFHASPDAPLRPRHRAAAPASRGPGAVTAPRQSSRSGDRSSRRMPSSAVCPKLRCRGILACARSWADQRACVFVGSAFPGSALLLLAIAVQVDDACPSRLRSDHLARVDDRVELLSRNISPADSLLLPRSSRSCVPSWRSWPQRHSRSWERARLPASASAPARP